MSDRIARFILLIFIFVVVLHFTIVGSHHFVRKQLKPVLGAVRNIYAYRREIFGRNQENP